MNKEEKSLFDEIWDAAGLSKEEPAAEVAEEVAPAAVPVEEPVETVEEPVETVEEPVETVEEPVETVEEPTEEPIEQPEAPAEEPKEEPKEEKKTNEHTDKKKSVKFLVVYTIAFVLVVAALISGSYMISSRLRQEMEGGEGASQSKLENIRDKNAKLKKENAAVKAENEELIASQADADALIDSAGDMVEHNEYVAAAMEAYIKGNRADARAILSTVDREKLSPTYQTYYDTLDARLN